MLLASDPISAIAQPFFKAFAVALALFYSWIPNYAVAIALLTIVVMVVVFPITRRGTRSMMRMQIYQPELKKLTQRYKAPPGASAEEKAQLRREQQEEMMAFYKENNISPTGGCLPMFLQLPIFWILYGTIRGLVHTTTKTVHGVKMYVAAPLYISHHSRLYEAIMAANSHPVTNSGNIKLQALGIDLADSVRSSGLSWGARTPYILMILAAVGLQYVQMKQLSGRNPAAAAANPQMQSMQKVFPIVFAVIYTAIPAGVNVYFIVSSLFRISQQEFMYRRDPQLQESLRQLRERHAATQKGAPPPAPRQPGLLGWLGIAPPPADALAAGAAFDSSAPKTGSTTSNRGPRPSGSANRPKGNGQARRPASGTSLGERAGASAAPRAGALASDARRPTPPVGKVVLLRPAVQSCTMSVPEAIPNRELRRRALRGLAPLGRAPGSPTRAANRPPRVGRGRPMEPRTRAATEIRPPPASSRRYRASGLAGLAESVEWVETTGRTVREALDAALDELGVDEQDAEVIVLEEPRAGLFGLRRSEARIRARVRPTAPRPKRPQRQRQRRGDGEAEVHSARAAGPAAGGERHSEVGKRAAGPRRQRSGDGGDRAPGSGRPGERSAAARDAAGAGDGSTAVGRALGPRASRGPGSSPRDGNAAAASGTGMDDAHAVRRRRRRGRSRRSAEHGETTIVAERQEGQMGTEEQAAAAGAFVQGVLERFALDGRTDVVIEPDQVLVRVTGDDLGLLVGPRGVTLDALQELTRTVVQRRGEEHGTRINVDVAGYRAKRAAALREFVARVAAEVVASGEARALEPMSSPDRKIVHDAANLVSAVETTSEGTDPHRYVVIRPAQVPGAANSADGDA